MIRERLRAILQEGIPRPQTRTPSATGFAGRASDIDRDEPPKDDYDTFRKQYRTFALLHAAINVRATETVEPGYRIEADDDSVVEELEEWASNAAVVNGETGRDLHPLLWQVARNLDLDGTDLIEHVYENPEQADQTLGLKLIDPSTTDFVSYRGTSRLLRPEEDDETPEDVPRTRSGEVPAYIQQPERMGFDQGEQVYLSQNDVTKLVRNPTFDDGRRSALFSSSADADAASYGPNRGVSLVESVSDEVRRVRERLQDYNASIASQAYPRLLAEFEDYTVGDGAGMEVTQWEKEDMSAFMDAMTREDSNKKFSLGDEWTDPGGSVGSPPGVDVELHEGAVPDVIPSLKFSVDYILSGLEVPKYVIGFSDDVNRRVTEEQEPRFERSIKAVRRDIERAFTDILETVAEERDLSTEGLAFRLDPEPEENPLKDEEIDAEDFATIAQGIAQLVDSNAELHFDDLGQFIGDLLNIDADEYGLDSSDVQRMMEEDGPSEDTAPEDFLADDGDGDESEPDDSEDGEDGDDEGN